MKAAITLFKNQNTTVNLGQKNKLVELASFGLFDLANWLFLPNNF